HTRFSRDWSSDVCSSDLGRESRGDRGLGSGDPAAGGPAPGPAAWSRSTIDHARTGRWVRVAGPEGRTWLLRSRAPVPTTVSTVSSEERRVGTGRRRGWTG